VSTYNTANTVDQAHETSDRETEANDAPLHIGSEPYTSLPRLVPGYPWPSLLRDILGFADNAEQRDILLLTALTALGATLGKTVRCLYGMHWIYPCIQLFVIAPPASGKGIMAWLRKFIEPIHREIRQQVDLAMKQYRQDLAAYHALGKEKAKMEMPQMPKNSMFIISGNNTGTGILQNIMDNNGTGLICETEADTISTAIGSEYGHWSETLRRAFDHDWLAYNRRTNQEYRENKKSYLSLLLSGTPAQVKPLIPSVENGLFSRQLFYYMHGIYQWINQFDENETDLEAIFTSIGLEWKKLLNLLKEHGLHTLRLTDEQKQEFNDLFSELFTRSTIANGREMNSSIARMAVNICRIMSVVAMLRAFENPQPYQYQASSHPLLTPDKEIATDNIKDGIITRWDMTITPEDFKAVLNLVKPLYQHATHILSFLPPSEVSHRANADRDAFFEALGIQFTRAQLLEQATTMGIKPNTALTWLKRLVKQGLIVNLDGKGTYAHARVCVC